MNSFVKRSVSSSGEVILSFFVFRYVSKRFCTLRMRPETSGMMIFFPVICSMRTRIRTASATVMVKQDSGKPSTDRKGNIAAAITDRKKPAENMDAVFK